MTRSAFDIFFVLTMVAPAAMVLVGALLLVAPRRGRRTLVQNAIPL